MIENIAHSECGRAHGPNWLRWLWHLRHTPAIHLEIGTFEGDSAEWWLDNIGTHEGAHLHCIDPFTGAPDHKFHGVDCSQIEQKARAKLARFPNITIHKGYSQDVLPTLPLAAFDSAYIDGLHTSRGVMCDAVFTFNLVKVGGVIYFDDYAWQNMPDPLDCPKIGIDAFLAAYAKHLEVLSPRGWQVAVKKISE